VCWLGTKRVQSYPADALIVSRYKPQKAKQENLVKDLVVGIKGLSGNLRIGKIGYINDTTFSVDWLGSPENSYYTLDQFQQFTVY
jgi:hypothetical protein